jgi:hypothetical protein
MMEEEHSPSDDEIIRRAFEIEGKSPTELLLQLGTLDLWRGDLSVMRGDVPATSSSEPEPEVSGEAEARADDLYASIVMKNALQYMTEQCRDVLYLRYVEHWDINALADELEMSVSDADQLASNCRTRAYQLLENLENEPLSVSASEPFVPRKIGIRQLPGKTRRAR